MLKRFINLIALSMIACPVLYENALPLYPSPFTVERSGCGGIISSPSTGEGGVGVIFILRCAQKGHQGWLLFVQALGL